MNQPEPIRFDTEHKQGIVLDDPKQVITPNGIRCIDAGQIKVGKKFQKLAIRLDTRPALAAQVDAWLAEWDAYKAWQAAEFDRHVPGLKTLEAAESAAYNEQARYDAEFERMMSRGTGIGPRPVDKAPAERAAALRREYPRAALYLRAQGYTFASNYHKVGAGRKAMELLAAGSSIEDAETILKNWLPEESIWA